MRTTLLAASALWCLGCGPAVEDEPRDEAVERACASYCEVEDQCDFRSYSECFDGCIERREFQTDHCRDISIAETECITQNVACEYFDEFVLFRAGEGPMPEIVCPELNHEKSICLVTHQDEINGADDD